jgi:hypothetical protein
MPAFFRSVCRPLCQVRNDLILPSLLAAANAGSHRVPRKNDRYTKIVSKIKKVFNKKGTCEALSFIPFLPVRARRCSSRFRSFNLGAA